MSLSDEIEDWLADDITGHVEDIVFIARPAQRGAHGGARWRDLDFKLRGPGGKYIPIGECTPEDLRDIAGAHEEAAAELTTHAAELRGYADDIDGGSDLGARIAAHLRAIRDSRARAKDERERAYAVARGATGVITVFGDAGCKLYHAGLLTVDDARHAFDGGRLLRVKGIGPSRFAHVVGVLNARERESSS